MVLVGFLGLGVFGSGCYDGNRLGNLTCLLHEVETGQHVMCQTDDVKSGHFLSLAALLERSSLLCGIGASLILVMSRSI